MLVACPGHAALIAAQLGTVSGLGTGDGDSTGLGLGDGLGLGLALGVGLEWLGLGLECEARGPFAEQAAPATRRHTRATPFLTVD
ncbi:MAG: hypothetical protein ACREOM_03445 [Candidatus Dormibacteraceae bacterium]